jgi:hypothetical protein
MNRYNLDLDDTEFKLIRERSRKRRRPNKAKHTISKRERAALKKWEMEIIKEYEKANEKTKRKKSCKKQPLIKTLYAIKKPKTSSRKKRRSTKAVQNPEEQKKESVEPVVAAESSSASTEPTEPTVSPASTESTEPTVSPPASTEETVAKPAEEQPSENKTVLSSMAESLGISSSNQEQAEKPATTEAKTGGKRKRKGCKKGGK